ncbi:hypothetical protein RIR_jg25318.t1 [Rhizophagus irregularis DAOM 181602=DAOM 197198]|nr:hypothetical protein RIR_jg25318.t1 [Rhizophagus irregularis DAOM 181602=DAOM 197198]
MLKDDESNINPSLSKANQAEAIEGGEESISQWNEPSIYSVCVEENKEGILTSSIVKTGQCKPVDDVEGGLFKWISWIRPKCYKSNQDKDYRIVHRRRWIQGANETL